MYPSLLWMISLGLLNSLRRARRITWVRFLPKIWNCRENNCFFFQNFTLLTLREIWRAFRKTYIFKFISPHLRRTALLLVFTPPSSNIATDQTWNNLIGSCESFSAWFCLFSTVIKWFCSRTVLGMSKNSIFFASYKAGIPALNLTDWISILSSVVFTTRLQTVGR